MPEKFGFAVELEAVTHAYGSVRALDAVTLRIPAGQVFGLLGPNGGGKTTLFKLLATLLPVQGGKITVLGLNVARQPDAVRSRIGVTFQHPSLDRQLTVRENLRYQGWLYGLSGGLLNRRIAELAEQLGLKERLGDRCISLSGGLQRRVEIAKGLLHQPQLLLLDEPSTGLDPGARVDLWTYLAALSTQQAVSVLTTTHLMEEAERCDRLAIIDRGRIVDEGSPTALRSAIGGEILTISAAEDAPVDSLLRTRFGLEAVRLGNGWRVEVDRTRVPLGSVLDALGDLSWGLSLNRPTLEDVFIQRTGHRFWNEAGHGN